jgi:hypothetical protein
MWCFTNGNEQRGKY